MVAGSGGVATRVATPPPPPPAGDPGPTFADAVRTQKDGAGDQTPTARDTATMTAAATAAQTAPEQEVANPFAGGPLSGAALSQLSLRSDAPVAPQPGASGDPPAATGTTEAPATGFTSLDAFPGAVPPKLLNSKLTEKVHDLTNDDYAVTYSGVSRTPLVSSEHLTKASVAAAGKITRDDDFRADTRLPADERSELSDYKGYVNVDRGHMAPNGDMPTRTAANQSFLLSNMVPQAADQNEGVWEQIESGVRDATGTGGDIYVASGPAFIGSNLESLNGRVLIPTDTWKAVYIPSENKMGVYWVPNTNTVTSADVQTISVNELQQRIGIDVFPSVTDPALRNQASVPPLAKADFTGRVDPTSPDADDLTKHS